MFALRHTNPLSEKGSTLKGTNVVPKRQFLSLFCPLSEMESSLEKTPSQKGDKTILKELSPLKVYRFHLTL